eukprot:gb/GFBE01000224.1/.p1 GENE.gb/GFBE01000224.1/~~gb/GFBE01000224.1/.p1  ORF type:complete len:358 (+),score=53.24 gb/GFBE01000224.1/:1-1074(+)
MGESHAYGTSLFCFSRRHFILGFSALMLVMCCVRSLAWVVRTGFGVGNVAPDLQTQLNAACSGAKCFEVLSCYGLKDTTRHVMEPLMSLSGLVFYPLGLHAAYHTQDLEMRRFGLYLLASAAIHVGVVIADYAYLQTCNAYPTNIISFTLSEQFFPPSPLRPGDQDILRTWSTYPVQATNEQAQFFSIPAWYFAFAGVWAMVFVYASIEALQLSYLMEHGLLGLGVHFGLDQWSEVLNHDAIRRKLNNERRSKFIDDANLPLAEVGEAHGALGYSASTGPRGYGSLAATSAMSKASSADWDYARPSLASTRVFRGPNGGAMLRAVDEEEAEAEALRALAERLAGEDSPEAILDRAFL